MTVSDSNTPGGRPRRWNWLRYGLVASLALNLLFVGGGVARYFSGGPPERMSGVSQVQLIPRKFLGALDQGRRGELLKVFRDFGSSFRDGRRAAKAEVLNLAAALEAEPYDPNQVKSVVDAFSAQSSGLVKSGGEAALKIIAMLTPDERKLLARHIRLRDDGGHHRGPPDRPGDDD